MPTNTSEKLYGLPGPQNSAVLMDILSKLKQDLQHSRMENNKLIDQLNCLIALVKRAWSGEQGAALHLANIVGMEAPNFGVPEMNRNTPIPEKSRAVENWERFAVRLLEREYRAIQTEIQERQRLFIQNRQMYMDEVMDDHTHEMNKYALHKKTVPVEEVDRKFLRCYSAKSRGEGKRPPSGVRPRSAYHNKPLTAANMVDRADFTVGQVFGQSNAGGGHQNASNNAFTGVYKMGNGETERRLYRPRQQFDDPNRYKQTNLFDPDVIFSPEMMVPPREGSRQGKSRPLSATMANREATGITVTGVRPKSAVFITESKPQRPLKYETTRPVSGKSRPTGSAGMRGRRNSAPTRKHVPTTVNKKELHTRQHGSLHNLNTEEEEQYSQNSQENNSFENQSEDLNNFETSPGHVTQESEEEEESTPKITVKVKKTDPVDKFVEDLKLMGEMELDFKKQAMQLQKRLGIDSDGIVY